MSEATPWSCVEPPATSEGRRSNGIRRWRGTLTGCKAPRGTYPAATYFSGGVQTIGKPSTAGCTNNAIDTTSWANLLTNSPLVDCSLATDPSSCITVYGTPKESQYPLAVPNPWITQAPSCWSESAPGVTDDAIQRRSARFCRTGAAYYSLPRCSVCSIVS